MDFDSIQDVSQSSQQPKPPMFDDIQDAGAPQSNVDKLIASEKAEDIANQAVTLGEHFQRAVTNKLAMAAGIARGGTLGLSDVASNIVPGLPEKLKGLQEENPLPSLTGAIIGGGATSYLTGGVSGLLPKGAGLVASTAAMGTEGALFGAGNVVSEAALGDPTVNAQKVMSEMGKGFLFGAGLNVLAKGLEAALPSAMRTTTKVADAIKSKFKPGEEAIPEMQGAESFVDPTEGVKQPQTAKEIDNLIKQAKFQGYDETLPQYEKLITARQESPTTIPILDAQVNAHKSLDALNDYKTQRLTNPRLQALESVQKKALNDSIDSTIEGIAPKGREVMAGADDNGEFLADTFNKQLKAEQKLSGEMVGEAKKFHTEGMDNFKGSIDAMSSRVPAIAEHIGLDAEGNTILKPWQSDSGMPREVYTKLKDVFNGLKKNPQDFSKLFNIRDVLGSVEGTAPSLVKTQIEQMKAGMMDYMGNMVEGGPSALREGFKRYAINEEVRKTLETKFGIDTREISAHKVGKAEENITNKMFQDSETVKAAKHILPPEDFAHATANYLAQMRAKFTNTEGVFSSKNFDNFLTKKGIVLQDALADNPQALNHLKNYTLQSRIVPDAASINPSGTAQTWFKIAQEAANEIDGATDVVGMAKFLKKISLDKIEEHVSEQNFNRMLQGKTEKTSTLVEIGKMIEKANNAITSKAKSIFGNSGVRGGVIISYPLLEHEYNKTVKKVQEFASNPQKMMDTMTASSQMLYDHAPNITQGMHNREVANVQFLDSKIPKPNTELPLASKWEASKSQKATFMRYYETVNDPISVLGHVKNGTLTNESMEALTATNPHLLEEMQQKVMENINPKTAMNLNYSTKMALSKFLQQPLDEGMMPQVLAANQATYANPPQRQSQQAGKSTQGGMAKMSFADRAKTRTQKDDVKV